MRKYPLLIVVLIALGSLLYMGASQKISSVNLPVPTTLNDFFLKGSQPLQSGTFSESTQCDNCHGGYDPAAEPAFNWQGSMMAQAQRDPLYLACLAVSNQDAPDVGDLCIRCHSPKGWLEGRSTPTDGSALTAADRDGINCHFCHKMMAPSPVGVNPYPLDANYNTAPSGGSSTYSLDQLYLSLIQDSIPPVSANGMYVCDNADNRRGPYFDPKANHNVPYSAYHKESQLCGTCHDVSNPVYETQRNASGAITGYSPGAFNTPPVSFNPYDMFPIERTYSEWLVSAYNTPGGITGTSFGGNKTFVSSCQDCHMRDVTGRGCNKSYAPLRNDLPLHDMTGANTFIPDLIDSVFPGEAVPAALNAGKLRARSMLQQAASMSLEVNQLDSLLQVRVTNETGHKLPSGYPEGRRMWLNVKAWGAQGGEYFESGVYDPLSGILTKTGTKIYEIKPGLSPFMAGVTGLPSGPSFHFVLNDTIYSDNRIPPRGFTNANFDSIQSPVVAYSYEDGQYWDITEYKIPFFPDSVAVQLLYQTTSKEYVEFLRDNDSTSVLIGGKRAGQKMYELWFNNGKSAPEPMVDEQWTKKITYWIGAVSDQWEVAANWSEGVPDSNSTAIIPAGSLHNPLVSTISESCYNLYIASGASVRVQQNSDLHVYGDLQVRGNMGLVFP